jgi:hypothetical protein
MKINKKEIKTPNLYVFMEKIKTSKNIKQKKTPIPIEQNISLRNPKPEKGGGEEKTIQYVELQTRTS